MFGWCKNICPSGHEYLTSSKIPDDIAADLCNQIKDGVKAIIANTDGKIIDKPRQKNARQKEMLLDTTSGYYKHYHAQVAQYHLGSGSALPHLIHN